MSKEPEQKPAEEGSMTLWEHLDELRGRMVKMILFFLVGAIASWIYKEHLFGILTHPYVQAGGKKLHFPAPAAMFLSYIRLSALCGLVFALPLILYQIWAFIAPGLYSREKRFAAPFVLSSCALFAGGGYFCWKVAAPVAFQYLLSFKGGSIPGGIEIQDTVMVSDYLEFVSHMLLAFGLAFEMPVLVFFLSVAGLVTHKDLIKFFRYFIVVAFVVAAVLTPPDPLSQLLLAIPLCLLYGISILVAFIFARRREVPAPEAEPNQSSRA
jgi:sec-independent protein translocase protein TatC